MSTSFYDLTIGTYTQILEANIGQLKAGESYFSENGISLEEHIDDMATLHFQVVCITHHSLEAVNAMRSGEFLPPNYEQRDYAGLQALTESTLEALSGMNVEEINSLSDGNLVFKIGGNEIPFTNEKFALSFSLPNFYFHATTAYDILRAKGVPIGKRDFLGAMKVGT